jgi:perosamine synthetase
MKYSAPNITREDSNAVVDAVLDEDGILTQGPKLLAFEQALARYCGAKHAVAVSSGTAALHCALFAAGTGRGTIVDVPAMTFVATANSVLHCQAALAVSDVHPGTLLMDEGKIHGKAHVIVAVDYAGQPCDYEALRKVADRQGAILIADACHSLGASYKGWKVGTLADMTCFSFHPVKVITTGEGGAILTDNEVFANRMRAFRNHGIDRTPEERDKRGSPDYDVIYHGHNYRMDEMSAALGLSQLERLDLFIHRRQQIALHYTNAFTGMKTLQPLIHQERVYHAYHLYVVRIPTHRDKVWKALRDQGIQANVHYRPVNTFTAYGNRTGGCRVAEVAWKEILSLPCHPGLHDRQVDEVIDVVKRTLEVLR